MSVQESPRTIHSGQPPGRVSPSSVHSKVAAQLATATREVLVSDTGCPATAEPIAMFRRVDYDNLRPGVRYRMLFPDRARTTPALAMRLNNLALSGAQVRTMPEVPTAALAIDGLLAALPSGGVEGSGRVALFELPSVVRTTVELFERRWAAAVPLTAGEMPDRAELTGRDHELLALLSAGCTDEAAATRLGISVRTVRRMVSVIMSRLGARSRFQAGVKAADQGWMMAGLDSCA